MNRIPSLHDQPDSFGWISIALHWITAIIVIALWISGQSIQFLGDGDSAARRSLHVTLGLSAWLLLAGRIGWRLKFAHPRAAGQSDLTHRLARTAHYLMLSLLGLMLLTGPLQAFARDSLPSAAAAAHTLHSTSATLLALLVALHVLGALKHLMFGEDETLARIFVPRRGSR